MRAVIVSLALMLMVCSSATAWYPHGYPTTIIPPTSCPYGAAYADGCAGAPANGQAIAATFFTDARQSGQAQYKAAGGASSDHPPPWNVPGVDYAIGAYTADASLIDAKVSPPAGCSYVSASHWLRCGSGVTLNGYRMDGVGLYVDTGTVDIENNHYTITADNCRNYTGTFVNHILSGSSAVTANSNTVDFDTGCAITAKLYKQSGDPGLTTQTTGTASLSGTALTYSSTPTGTVRVGQYIDCTGCTEPAMIASGSGLSWVLNTSQPSLGPLTVTTGPVEFNANGWLGGGASLSGQYNFLRGMGEYFGGGQCTNSYVLKYNNADMAAPQGAHTNFAINLPGCSGTIDNFTQDFNAVYWNKISYLGTGTGSLDEFVAGPGAASGDITTTNYETNNNVIIGNTTVAFGLSGNTTAALLRYLNQSAGVSANINYSLAAGVLTVTAVNSGTLSVGDYVGCSSSLPTCTLPIKITSFGTGSGGTGTYNIAGNTVDSVSKNSQNVQPHSGIIGALVQNANYLDPTGANSAFLGDPTVPKGSETYSGNINMLSGNACTPSSCP